MPEMSIPDLRAAVLAAFTTDPKFVSAFTDDPLGTIESRYGRQSYRVRVVFSEPGEMPILIPRKTPDAESAVRRALGDDGSTDQTQEHFFYGIVGRAWTDPSFLNRLVAEPRQTLDESLLGQYGRKLDGDADPVIHVEQEGECCIVIPSSTTTDSPIAESELERVAGGGIGFGTLAAGIIVVSAIGGILSSMDDGECE